MSGPTQTVSAVSVRAALAAVWGPGLLVMLADADAGNIVAAAQSGAMWGYRLLPLLLGLIPALFMVQELTVRLGLATGLGFGALVRQRCGPAWAWLCAAVLTVAVMGSLVTEFTGIAGVGDLWNVPRAVSLPLTAACLLAVVLGGAYQRVERIAMAIGAFELIFMFVAWRAQPSGRDVMTDIVDLPIFNSDFLFLVAALIGATFNPWMIFFQQSATAAKRLDRRHLTSARWDTAVGAVLTQVVTAAVLVAAAATIGTTNPAADLGSVGRISDALTPFLGMQVGRALFSAGVLGAATVAAIVSSLALAWGIGEIAGRRLGVDAMAHRQPWFRAVFIAAVGSAALLTLSADSLVRLNIEAQVANAVLLPLPIGTAVILAATVLQGRDRLRGWYLWLVAAICSLVGALGLAGAVGGL